MIRRNVQRIAGSNPFVHRLLVFTISVSIVTALACQSDQITLPHRTDNSGPLISVAPGPNSVRISAKTMRSRAPRLTDTNSCFTTERATGRGRPLEFSKTRVSKRSDQNEQASAATTRFFYIRWNKLTGEAVFQANCVIPRSDAAYDAALASFSMYNGSGRVGKRNRPSLGANTTDDNAQDLPTTDLPVESVDDAGLAPQLAAVGADVDPDHRVNDEAEFASEDVDGSHASYASPFMLGGMPGEMSSLLEAEPLPAPPAAGVFTECSWEYGAPDIDCEDLQCELEMGGDYDCGNGCELEDSGGWYTMENDTWFCWEDGDYSGCERQTDVYEVHTYMWHCDNDYCGDGSGGPWWWDPPECPPEEEEEEPCEGCEPPSPPANTVEFQCDASFAVGGEESSGTGYCTLTIVDTSQALDNIVWWFTPWSTLDSIPGGSTSGPVDNAQLAYTATTTGAYRVSYRINGVQQPPLWSQGSPRDEVVYDDCDLEKGNPTMWDDLDSTVWYRAPNPSKPAAVICEGSGALSCLTNNPGQWVGTWIINSGQMLGARHAAIVIMPPSPPNVTELVGWTESLFNTIDSGSTPHYGGGAFSAYRWVKVGDTTAAFWFNTARTQAIQDFTTWNVGFVSVPKLYIPPNSNIFVSSILYNAGVELNENQTNALGPTPGLCHCGRSTLCPHRAGG